MKFNIERINLTLHGISADIASKAMTGLEQELTRRLGVFDLSGRALAGLDSVRLRVENVDSTLDVAALRQLVADRIATVIVGAGVPEANDQQPGAGF